MENIEYVYSIFTKNYKITTDSRKVEPGSIFFALRGDNFDGNKFALDALKKGASCVIVDEPELKDEEGCIFTQNVLTFLQKLAEHHRKQLSIPIIGLTGSNGKTTTKELLREVLSYKYKVCSTQGNLNNHIGVPLTVLSITPEVEIAVVEMGANHVGEIELLCSIAKPTHGIITNIGKAHIGEFGGFEGVIKAKTELYQFLNETQGTIFYNSDNDLLYNEVVKYKKTTSISYGIGAFSTRTIPGREPFLTVSVEFPNRKAILNTQLTGHYNLENILAACCVGQHFNVESEGIKERIDAFSPSNSRSQVVDTQKNRVILDAYNANPSSMEVALASFASIPSEKGKVVLLGEMLELGEYAHNEHFRIATMALNFDFEEVILVGNSFPNGIPGSRWFETSKECALFLEKVRITDKLVLVKGSRGTRMEVVMDFL